MLLRLPLLTVTATALCSFACAVHIDQAGYVEREEKRFSAEAVAELRLYTFDGSIEVRAWDRPEIVVSVEKRGADKDAIGMIQVMAERSGDRIQVEVRQRGRTGMVGHITIGPSLSAKLIVNVPASINLLARSGDGSVLVERLQGRIELRTDDGSIRTFNTGGELIAHTGDGSVQLDDVTGRVDAKTADGTLRVTGTPSVLHAMSGDGSVVVRVRAGAVMSDDWSVGSDDGSISVELPSSFNATIQADPGSDGRVRSELALVDIIGGTRADRILRGRMGEGGKTLQIRTGDGTIHLRKD